VKYLTLLAYIIVGTLIVWGVTVILHVSFDGVGLLNFDVGIFFGAVLFGDFIHGSKGSR